MNQMTEAYGNSGLFILDVVRTCAEAQFPSAGSADAACYDLYSAQNVTIPAGETIKVDTGLQMAIPHGYWGAIFARSGLATKQGLRPANCVGVIDSDYRGNWIVAVHNDSRAPQEIKVGDRIAQFALLPRYSLSFNEVQELNSTDRGAGGFGHSGR